MTLNDRFHLALVTYCGHAGHVNDLELEFLRREGTLVSTKTIETLTSNDLWPILGLKSPTLYAKILAVEAANVP